MAGRKSHRRPAERSRLEQLESLSLSIEEMLDAHPPSLISRGRSYRRRVGSFSWQARHAQLKCPVQGSVSEPYQVTFYLADDRSEIVDAGCTCPYGESWGLCKHTAAAAMRLDEHLTIPSHPVRTLLTGSDPTEPWREVFNELDLFVQRRQADLERNQPDSQKRLTWRIGYVQTSYNPKISFRPYEQKISKRQNRWTKGRKISWSQVAENTQRWTTEADRAIGAMIHRDGGPEYYRYYAHQYQPDLIATLRRLAEHPHVTWSDQPEQTVEIVVGELGLTVKKVRGGMELVPAFNGAPLAAQAEWIAQEQNSYQSRDCTEGLVGVERQANRILVADADADLLKLVKQLHGLGAGTGTGLKIPKRAQEEVFQRLAAIEPLVPVALPEEMLGGTVQAAEQLHLRLAPNPQSFEVQLCAQPTETSSVFQPGQGPETLTAVFQGKRVTVHRNLADEAERAAKLCNQLGLDQHPEQTPFQWHLPSNDDALDLIAAVQDYPDDDLVVEWPEDAQITVSREVGPQALRVEITDRQDWFGLEGSIDVDGMQVKLATLLAGIQSGRRYVAVGPNSFIRITQALRDRLAAVGDVVHHTRSGLELDVTAAPVVDELVEADVSLKASRSWKKVVQRLETATQLHPEPPLTLQAELRDYQLDGYRWMRRLAAWGVGGCLADDMGLGKTVQALAVLLDRMDEGPALVVAPTSVGFNWVREAERFAPTLQTTLYRETDRNGFLNTLAQGDLVVISYGLLMRDIEKLAAVEWGTLVLDEAQQIKNSQTKTARAVRSLEAAWRLALTGTPVENHLGELWSLFRAISPGLFGSWDRFRQQFAEPIEKQKRTDRRHALSRVVRPFILRRTKSEVLEELPARTEILRSTELSPAEFKLYDATRLEAALQLAKPEDKRKSGDQRFRVLAALTKLRQLACHPSLVDAGWKKSSAKLDLFLEIVDELREGKHRALVFSQFTQHLGLLRQALDEREISYLYLDGQTNARQRRQRVDAFQHGEGELFLISLKAGGTGLNLTGADYVIHMDPWWNPAVEDQATDRAHRMGQTRPVTVYRLVAKNTIEEQILALHANKRDLVAGVLAGTDRAGKLSTDELIALIQSGDQKKRNAAVPAPKRRKSSRRKVAKRSS